MASNINWFGAVPTAGLQMNERKPFDLSSKEFVNGMDMLGGVFDRWNREKAIDGKLSDLKERLEQLKARRAELQSELNSAAVETYSDSTYEQVANTDPTVKMGGYASPSNSMIGYGAAVGAYPTRQPNVRF